MSKRQQIAALMVLIGLLASMLLSGPIVDHHLHTCALCRLNRSDYHSLGITWPEIKETECSGWYRSHVETEHVHLWIPARSGSHLNAFGTPSGAWDSWKDRGVFRLRSQDQIRVYQKAPDFGAAKRLFAALGSAMLSNEDSADERVKFDSSVLAEWAEKDFETPWNDITIRLKPEGY
jgi:hypothetical protein